MSTFSTAEERKERRLAHNVKRFAGTYRDYPKPAWERIATTERPDFASLYPVKANGAPAGLLPPRMAAKLFSDALLHIKNFEENPKYLQDRLPEGCHKFYKKKQWRRQMFESCKRVVCRIAKGKGFNANCIAEEAFVHVVLQSASELGWNRSKELWEDLPESDKDRDFARVIRAGGSDEVLALWRGEDKGDAAKYKSWFAPFDSEESRMTDHFLHDDANIAVEDEKEV
jgi:hypothetical protein